jgi:O-antigen/teichoic acid export membrane protein
MSADESQTTADDSQVSPEELRDKTLNGVRWISATRLAFELVAAAGAVVLAHLIPPAEYGRYAIVLFLPEIALSLVNEGLGIPLVQRKTITGRHVEATTALGLAIGAALTAITFFLAPIVADPLFGKNMSELFQLYSPVFIVAGLLIVPLAMLQRRLDFNRIGISEVVSAAVTTAVSVVLALLGLDAKAYVLGGLAGLLAWALMLMFTAGVSPVPRVRTREMREIASTGAPAAGAGLAGIGSRNADYAILGSQLSAAQVGFYYRAFTIGVEYERKLSGIVTRIAFPVYSRTKDITQLRNVRRRIVRMNSTIIFPLLAFFMVVAPVIVPWLFGERWAPAVVLAQILAVAGMATSLKNTVDPLILATGRPRPLLYFNICELAVYVAMLLYAASTGDLIIVCVAVSTFRVVALIASYWVLLGKVVGASLSELFFDAGAALAACLAFPAVALPIRLGVDLPTLPLLALCAVASFPVYALALRIISPTAWADIMLVVGRMIPGYGRLRGRMRAKLAINAAVAPASGRVD